MRLTLKLLILIAVLVAMAGLAGGWKWDANSGKKRAADYTLVADPNSPVSVTSTDTSIAPRPADPNGSASSTSPDTSRTSHQPTQTARPRAQLETSHPLVAGRPNGLVANTPADTSSTRTATGLDTNRAREGHSQPKPYPGRDPRTTERE